MSYTIKTTGQVDEDKTLHVTVPTDLAPGEVVVTLTVQQPHSSKKKMTMAELANSEFFGDWKDRDDLPKTPEEFREWRRKLWERSPN